MPFNEWIEAVAAVGPAEVGRMPAAKIPNFYCGLEKAGARSRETETHETANGVRYSETFLKLQPVDRRLMEIWLRQWGF